MTGIGQQRQGNRSDGEQWYIALLTILALGIDNSTNDLLLVDTATDKNTRNVNLVQSAGEKDTSEPSGLAPIEDNDEGDFTRFLENMDLELPGFTPMENDGTLLFPRLGSWQRR